MFNPEHGPRFESTPEENKETGGEQKEVTSITSGEIEEAIELGWEIHGIKKEMGKSDSDREVFHEAEKRMGERYKRFEELNDKIDRFQEAFGIEAFVRILEKGRKGKEGGEKPIEFRGDIMQGGKWLAIADPNEAMRILIRRRFAKNIRMDTEELMGLEGVTAADLEEAMQNKTQEHPRDEIGDKNKNTTEQNKKNVQS